MAPTVRSIVTVAPLEDDPLPLPAPLADAVVAALSAVVAALSAVVAALSAVVAALSAVVAALSAVVVAADPFVGVAFDSASVVVA